MPLTDLVKTPLYDYGIWNIRESVEWFLEHVELSEEERKRLQSVGNETVRKQWLACRMILSTLIPGRNREIHYNTHGKPFLGEAGWQISLSHSGEYAAAIVSGFGDVGIDIEKKGPRILSVAERFMTPDELENARGDHFQDKLYIHWCTKEAVYKMLGDPGVNLFCDIILAPFDYLCTESGDCEVWIKDWERSEPLKVHFRVSKDYYLAFTIVLNEAKSPDG
jgi:4'-phosphopantetheinyl transferase